MRVVVEKQRDIVAGLQTECDEPPGDLPSALVQFPVRENGARVGKDESGLSGVVCGPVVQCAHGCLSFMYADEISMNMNKYEY